jgi:hypothetical protein
MTAPYNSRFSAVEYPYAKFGVIGGFAWDDELGQEIEWCHQAFSSPSSLKPPLARLVKLLDVLPVKGRHAVVRTIIAPSPHRDAILRDLWDYCFQADDDDDVDMEEDASSVSSTLEIDEDFVLIANPDADGSPPKPLNLNRHHIFQTVIVLAALSGKAGADASRRYLQSASTRHRAKILIQCVTTISSEYFTDDELWNAFLVSPGAVQQKVVQACKQSGKRVDLLQRVYEKDTEKHSNLIYWLPSDNLAPILLVDELERNHQHYRNFKFKRWGAHGQVYLDFIRKQCEACGQDRLKVGKIWTDFERRIELHSVRPAHVHVLLGLVDKYEPYKVKSGRSKEVQEYLMDLSVKGDEDIRLFDQEVEPIYLSHKILEKLTKPERMQLVSKAFESRDWYPFNWFQDLVLVSKLPHAKICEKATSDDLWIWLLPDEGAADPFLDFSLSLSSDLETPFERASIVQLRADLFLRSQPSDWSAEQQAKYASHGMQKCWSSWYQSFNESAMDADYISHITTVLRQESPLPISLGSRLTFYAQHLKGLIEMTVKGMNAASPHLEPKQILQPLLELTVRSGCSYTDIRSSNVPAVRNLSECISDVLIQQVLPRLASMLPLDSSNPSTYATTGANIGYFESTCSSIVEKWAINETVAKELASLILNGLELASKVEDSIATGTKSPRFAFSADVGSSRRRLIHLNVNLPRKIRGTCLRLIKNILARLKSCGSFAFSKQLWTELVKEEKHHLANYLSTCSLYLPEDLKEAERPSMIAQSQASIASRVQLFPFGWKGQLYSEFQQLHTLDILEKVVWGCKDIPDKDKDSVLRDHAGFGNDKVQQMLKDETFVADGNDRSAGLIQWLDRAFDTQSVLLTAKAMSFAASRLRNESGVNRRTVFAWLKDAIVPNIVLPSLDDDGGDLAVLKELSATLILIQKNDFSRLDSVGRMELFPQLPELILEATLGFDAIRLNQERRQLWVDCAIRLHWTSEQATSGDEGLRCYSWPCNTQCPRELKSAAWVSPEHFQDAYPLAELGNSEKLSTLLKRQGIVFSQLIVQKDFDKENVFGPEQCIDMLHDALKNLWRDDFPCAPLHVESSFPEDEAVAEALLGRLQVALRLCGSAWQEVEVLTTTFDNVFSNLDSAALIDSNFSCASSLLETLIDIHNPNYALQVPRLAHACDVIFRSAVAHSRSDYMLRWFSYWRTLFFYYGSRDWGSMKDERFRLLILKHSVGCEPNSCRNTLSKSDKAARNCIMVRELLAMSTSALAMKDVCDILLRSREDAFIRYSDVCTLRGPFSCFAEHDSFDSMLFENVEVEALVSCSAAICRRYAHFALKEATNPRNHLRTKMNAIKMFVGAPTTQHSDVLLALQSDLEEAIREVLINRVFSLDSPWHILGFLLSQSAIEKNDQRVTAILLGYVAQHVHVSKVVRVLEVLLKHPRRKKLSFQLHKAVVRMLFDARTSDAMRLLRVEWESELPVGVRNLVVEKCMEATLAGGIDGWEASVLSQVATDLTLELETKFLLFAPRGAATGPLGIEKADGCETDELLDRFRQKQPPPLDFTSEDVAGLLYSVLEQLEQSSEGSLQALAKCKKLSMARIFAGKLLSDDQGALDEMFRILTSPLPYNHQSQVVLSYLSHLTALGVATILNHALSQQKADQMSIEEVGDFCKEIAVARKFKDCLQTLLGEVLALPIKKGQRRKQLLKSFQTLLATLEQQDIRRRLVKVLFSDPFKSELDLLEKDASLVNAVVRRTSIN